MSSCKNEFHADEPADKPDSVPLARYQPSGGDHLSRTSVTAGLKQPTRTLGRAALERVLLGFAPGGVYLAGNVTIAAGGLLHHPFTLTTYRSGGGLLSVALSRGSPRVAVSHHLALRSPDVPRVHTHPRPPS